MKTYRLAELERRIEKAIELIKSWEPTDPRDNYYLQPYWDQLLEILVEEEQS